MTTLAKGFEVRQEGYSTLYAVRPDGSILQSNSHTTDINFNCKGRTWMHVEAVPTNAEFIGNYAVPGAQS